MTQGIYWIGSAWGWIHGSEEKPCVEEERSSGDCGWREEHRDFIVSYNEVLYDAERIQILKLPYMPTEAQVFRHHLENDKTITNLSWRRANMTLLHSISAYFSKQCRNKVKGFNDWGLEDFFKGLKNIDFLIENCSNIPEAPVNFREIPPLKANKGILDMFCFDKTATLALRTLTTQEDFDNLRDLKMPFEEFFKKYLISKKEYSPEQFEKFAEEKCFVKECQTFCAIIILNQGFSLSA